MNEKQKWNETRSEMKSTLWDLKKQNSTECGVRWVAEREFSWKKNLNDVNINKNSILAVEA